MRAAASKRMINSMTASPITIKRRGISPAMALTFPDLSSISVSRSSYPLFLSNSIINDYVYFQLMSASKLKLVAHKIEICPLACHQGVMIAGLYNLPSIKNHYAVGIPDRREPMGHHYYSASAVEVCKVLHYRPFVARIERVCGLTSKLSAIPPSDSSLRPDWTSFIRSSDILTSCRE